MAYVITQNCCKDASCVPVCPVDCIRPVGAASEVAKTEMLYIDPAACIDCGACLEECPVDAIFHEDDVPAKLAPFKDINAAYFQRYPLRADEAPLVYAERASVSSLRVAVVGAGPAACYATAELVAVEGVEVNLFERLPTPFGLIRAGVAPDHQHTKQVVSVFDPAFRNRRVQCYFGVEIGEHLTHDELLTNHNAVIYAVGASGGRKLGVPGEDLANVHSAGDFVSWYNGHPDHTQNRFDVSGERAVIIGNGNVALDVARILLSDDETLAATDIADHALSAASKCALNEVVIVGRRGVRDAAFSAGEFLALGHLPGVDIVVKAEDLEPRAEDTVETVVKLQLAREYQQREPSPGNKRIVFRFHAKPVEFVGEHHVEGVRLAPTRNAGGDHPDLIDLPDESELLPTSLVLSSIGYKGRAIAGIPFDERRGVVPSSDGRVVDETGRPMVGVYVTGWIKRGPQGVIGTNRTCAQDTVRRLWEDVDAGLLDREVGDGTGLRDLLAERGAEPIGWDGWQKIDRAERQRGSERSRPRVKFVDVAEMVAVATDIVYQN